MSLSTQTEKSLLDGLDLLQLFVPPPFQLARCKPIPERLRRRIVQKPSSPHTPVAPVCWPGRHVGRRRPRSIPPVLANWLPHPEARSPSAVPAPLGGPPSRRQSRCNTAHHRRSRPCRDNGRSCRGHPSSVHLACVHNVRSGGAPPEDPGRRGSPPSIRPPPSSPNSAASFVGSLRRWPSQYNPHDDRG